MSISFRPLGQIRAADIFDDGWLHPHGVYEHEAEDTTATLRCLSDDKNYVWVSIGPDGFVRSFTCWALSSGNRASSILNAVQKAFEARIVSEYEPEFWGFATQAEWDAAWAKLDEELASAERAPDPKEVPV